MKSIILVAIIAIFASCRGCVASHAERKAAVLKLCPTCTFVQSESTYYAVDTSQRPNIIYRVRFKQGGVFYKASDVDDLIRVN